MNLDGDDTVIINGITVERVDAAQVSALVDLRGGGDRCAVELQASEPALTALQGAIGTSMGLAGTQVMNVNGRTVDLNPDSIVASVNTDLVKRVDTIAVAAHTVVPVNDDAKDDAAAARKEFDAMRPVVAAELRRIAERIPDDTVIGHRSGYRDAIVAAATDDDTIVIATTLLCALRRVNKDLQPLTVAQYMVQAIVNAVGGDPAPHDTMVPLIEFALKPDGGNGHGLLRPFALYGSVAQWGRRLYAAHHATDATGGDGGN